MYKNILIPTDGSKLSHKAIVTGVALAQSIGAKVTGLFAAPPATPLVFERHMEYVTTGQHEAMIAKTAAQYLGVIEREAAKAGVKCEVLHVTNDFPADAILAVAKKKKCDLICLKASRSLRAEDTLDPRRGCRIACIGRRHDHSQPGAAQEDVSLRSPGIWRRQRI